MTKIPDIIFIGTFSYIVAVVLMITYGVWETLKILLYLAIL